MTMPKTLYLLHRLVYARTLCGQVLEPVCNSDLPSEAVLTQKAEPEQPLFLRCCLNEDSLI